MWRRIQDAFALTDQGMKDFMRGAGFCALANLMLMLPIVVLYFTASDFIRYLDDPSVGLPGMALYAAGIVAALVVMFVTQMWEYRATYTVVYQESARKRIAIAERLRLLPLSFFGRRDLSDLTSVIMKDCSDQERLFSHTMPQIFGMGRFDAGIRRYDVRVRLEAGGICSLAHSRGACGVASDYTHPEVAYREEECGIPFVCRWPAGIS